MLLGHLLVNYQKPGDLVGESGLLRHLIKLLVEKTLDAEMAEHLGQERESRAGG
ncbi:hypothetical protein [Rhodanobacter geophilus]|uniref:hypothetical protein n=1 Tax=Rhodanobacter geophilus TaxID=3162488 RepID=UPI003F5C9837